MAVRGSGGSFSTRFDPPPARPRAVAGVLDDMVVPVYGLASGARAWRLPIGAGGHVTGGTHAADDTVGMRTDTAGAGIYDASTGRFVEVLPANVDADLFVGAEAVSASVYDFQVCWGFSEEWVAVAPTATGAAVLRSSNRGITWRDTGRRVVADGNNGGPRTYQHHIGISPVDPATYIIGTETEIVRTTDDGTTWQTPVGLPPPTTIEEAGGLGNSGAPPTYTCVLADHHPGFEHVWTAHTGGQTFLSIDGGSSFDDISTGTEAAGLTFTNCTWWRPGTIVFTRADSGLMIYHLGRDRWRHVETDTPNHPNRAVLVNPFNTDEIVLAGHGQPAMQLTNDGLERLTSINWATVTATSRLGIGWHEEGRDDGDISGLSFLVDARVLSDGTVWLFGGNASPHRTTFFDLWDSARDYTRPAVVSHGGDHVGICLNELIPSDRADLPGWCASAWDEAGFLFVDPDGQRWPEREQVTKFTNSDGSNQSCWGLGVQPSDPGGPMPRVVMWATWEGRDNKWAGFSDDKGRTWTRWGDAFPWGDGDFVRSGRIEIGRDPENVIAIPGNSQNNGKGPHYTRNAGAGDDADWRPIVLDPSFDDSWDDGVNRLIWLDRAPLVFDRDTPGLAWFLVNAADSAVRGLWETRDGGPTWTRVSDLPIDQSPGFWNWSIKLKQAVDGTLWACSGSQGDPGTRGGPNVAVRRPDGSWSVLSEVYEASDIGLGAPLPGFDDPAVAFIGYLGDDYGMWVTGEPYDPRRRWEKVWGPVAPRNAHGFVRWLTGDPLTPGRFGWSIECHGAFVVDTLPVFEGGG